MSNEEKNPQNRAPQWVEFLRIETKEEMGTFASRFFGNKFSATDLVDTFGLGLAEFLNYYVEVGLVFAPDGPLVPGKVAPILVLRMDEDGKTFKPHVFRTKGFHDMQGKRAWLKAPEWDKLLGDSLYEDLEEKYSSPNEEQEDQ